MDLSLSDLMAPRMSRGTYMDGLTSPGVPVYIASTPSGATAAVPTDYMLRNTNIPRTFGVPYDTTNESPRLATSTMSSTQIATNAATELSIIHQLEQAHEQIRFLHTELSFVKLNYLTLEQRLIKIEKLLSSQLEFNDLIKEIE